MDTDDATIGTRVRILRRWRGMSQHQLAGLSGVSQGYISLIENGQRSLDRRSNIAAIAAALRVSETDLVGGPHLSADHQQADPHAGIPALRVALQTNTLTSPAAGYARPLADLARVLTGEIQPLYTRCDFTEIGRLLPPVIDELHVHVAAPADEAAHRLALETLIEACRSATFPAKALGYDDLAHAAATRAAEAAQVLDDPVAVGKAAYMRIQTMPRAGSWDRTLTAAEQAADALEPEARDPLGRQVLGMLTLSASLAAVATPGSHQSEHWMSEAAALAGTVPDTPEANWSAFSATNVGIWQVALAVERGESGGTVLDMARAVDQQKAARHRTRYAAFLTDVGRGLAREPKARAEAVRSLRRAEDIAPQQTRNSAPAREAVTFLLQRSRAESGGRELRGMASRMGIAH